MRRLLVSHGVPVKALPILILVMSIVEVSICPAQDFSVRLINVRNGRPFPNHTVTIQYRKTVEQSLDFETLTVKTNENGSAIFHLPMPLPRKVSVTTFDLYPCYDLQPTDTQQLGELGVASHCSKPSQGCRCKFSKRASQIKARPGEIVLLARPLTFREKLSRHIWE